MGPVASALPLTPLRSNLQRPVGSVKASGGCVHTSTQRKQVCFRAHSLALRACIWATAKLPLAQTRESTHKSDCCASQSLRWVKYAVCRFCMGNAIQIDRSGREELSKFNDQAADINFADYSVCRDARIAQTSDGGGNRGSVRSISRRDQPSCIGRQRPCVAEDREHDP